MREFFYKLFAFSGTAIAILLIAGGWLLKNIISEKSKLLGWIVFVLFCFMAIGCIILRNAFSTVLT